ncbi:MAG: thiamine pyrophosphate-dependent enzyme [Deltaproteobacteria bacterium]|nr:thiamine pyrophosphate-dependent enzyme [Deltaproteobacteria bacterium]MDA8179215.1 thiamine pyrophosphate-dependent enzyme [Deltaproteobacteria bacterium]
MRGNMRSATTGVLQNIASSFPANESLEIYRRMCISRHFELGLVRAVKEKRVTYPVYLSLGQETVAAALSMVLRDFMIFTQHRCHATFLCFGGPAGKLRDELMGLPTGTSGGRAGSNCIQCHENGVTMFGHHGLIGENVPQAVGAALGSGRPVVCFFGDGAAEEDYVVAAIGFASTHRLPILFVCEDNDLSILTPVEKRRSWRFGDVAASLGMKTVEIADDPWTIADRARELKNDLPAFMNIHVCRSNWHVGAGTDGAPEWDRFSFVESELGMLGLGKEAAAVKAESADAMEALWAP